jgi:hypothetical protein
MMHRTPSFPLSSCICTRSTQKAASTTRRAIVRNRLHLKSESPSLPQGSEVNVQRGGCDQTAQAWLSEPRLLLFHDCSVIDLIGSILLVNAPLTYPKRPCRVSYQVLFGFPPILRYFLKSLIHTEDFRSPTGWLHANMNS